MSKLNENFLSELFRLCFLKSIIIETCIEHLEFHHLPSEHHKEVWKSIKNYYIANDKVPTLGYLFQKHEGNDDVITVLSDIKLAEIADVEDILEQFEEYIKNAISVHAYDKFSDIYNVGDKSRARDLWVETAEKLSNFSIKNGSTHFETVFGDWEARHRERCLSSQDSNFKEKLPFSIDELDDLTYGGIDRGDTACFLARSGVGKTKLLRWIGMNGARRGMNIIHIQAEGSKEDCLRGYDATWSAVLMRDIRTGNINDKKYTELQKVVQDMGAMNADIYVHAFEQFNTANMMDVNNICNDFLKKCPQIDGIILDYMDEVDPGDGKKYGVSVNDEKARRENTARKCKNIAIHHNAPFITATQANDISPNDYNNPSWVMTRHNTSQAKSLINSFSYFITLNQTNDEYQNNVMRLYNDKLRHFRAQQTISIAQNYNRDRFYDRKRTHELFYKR